MTTLEVSWPTAPLSEQQWRDRLTDLAERAEAVMDMPCRLQDQATLAVHWLGLCWSGISPETIAGSCRASLLLGTPVVLSTAPADQVQEIAERLDRHWQAAQADPSTALVEVAPPLLELPPAKPAAPEAPADWLSSGEVCELLDVSRATLINWRNAGRLGAEGEGWGRRGRGHAYAPEAVEALMEPDVPEGFDQLVRDVQAAA
jgi:hypothetical protein